MDNEQSSDPLVELIRNIMIGWQMDRSIASLVLDDYAPEGVNKSALLEELFPSEFED